jgi:hypothetical protein
MHERNSDRSSTKIRLEEEPPFGSHGQYDENGVDLSLLRENLKLAPAERARRAERARKAALRVLQIGREARSKPA